MNILLPTDGSEAALEAVRHALRLVDGGLRATFVLANVQEPASLYEVVVAHDAEVIAQVSASASAHVLASAQALLGAAGVEFETESAHGDPGHELLAIVERYGCDAVIIGARGVAAVGSSPIGSVAHAVLHGAAVPVTVVKCVDAG